MRSGAFQLHSLRARKVVTTDGQADHETADIGRATRHAKYRPLETISNVRRLPPASCVVVQVHDLATKNYPVVVAQFRRAVFADRTTTVTLNAHEIDLFAARPIDVRVMRFGRNNAGCRSVFPAANDARDYGAGSTRSDLATRPVVTARYPGGWLTVSPPGRIKAFAFGYIGCVRPASVRFRNELFRREKSVGSSR